jgi:peptide deformylase
MVIKRLAYRSRAPVKLSESLQIQSNRRALAALREISAGLRAVCHQHEIDQLNGLVRIQRLSRLKRARLIKRFEKVSRSP